MTVISEELFAKIKKVLEESKTNLLRANELANKDLIGADAQSQFYGEDASYYWNAVQCEGLLKELCAK
jgi:hypothetical protein